MKRSHVGMMATRSNSYSAYLSLSSSSVATIAAKQAWGKSLSKKSIEIVRQNENTSGFVADIARCMGSELEVDVWNHSTEFINGFTFPE